MISEEEVYHLRRMKVKPGTVVKLDEYPTEYQGKTLDKEDAAELLDMSRKHLAIIQDKLYAHNQYSILIILQALDAAGKDGTIKHIMSGLNPSGVKVYSFKAPTAHELDHDYLWRHHLVLPSRGEIAIHNRSHYENVLVTRVHPEYILKENIPGIRTVEDIDSRFWKNRFDQINAFEKNLTDNGMIILKFFLHMSKEEQRKRLLSRIEDPSKNWKFELGDLKERGFWDTYTHAYEEALTATSRKNSPWYIIPADDKWYARLAIANTIFRVIEKLELHYPVVTEEQRTELLKAREVLLAEAPPKVVKSGKKKKSKPRKS